MVAFAGQIAAPAIAGSTDTADAVARFIYDEIPTGESLAILRDTSMGILSRYRAALLWNDNLRPAVYDPAWSQSRDLLNHLVANTPYTGEQIKNFLYAIEVLAANAQIDIGDYDPVGTVEVEERLAQYESEREPGGSDNGNVGLWLAFLVVGVVATGVVFRKRRHKRAA